MKCQCNPTAKRQYRSILNFPKKSWLFLKTSFDFVWDYQVIGKESVFFCFQENNHMKSYEYILVLFFYKNTTTIYDKFRISWSSCISICVHAEKNVRKGIYLVIVQYFPFPWKAPTSALNLRFVLYNFSCAHKTDFRHVKHNTVVERAMSFFHSFARMAIYIHWMSAYINTPRILVCFPCGKRGKKIETNKKIFVAQ